MVNRTSDYSNHTLNAAKNENPVLISVDKDVSNIQEKEFEDTTFEKFTENLNASKAKKMTESLNDFLETTSTKLRYEFHEKLEKYYVTLVDSETDQVIREIPNKKLMDMYASMLDFIGVLIDKKI